MASSATVSAPKKRKSFSEYFHSMRGQQLIVTLVFLFVPLVLLFMFTYLPFFKMVEFSFFKMKYIGRRTFVGLQNYISVFTRKDCFHALSLSLYYMVGSVVQMALALLFATILSLSLIHIFLHAGCRWNSGRKLRRSWQAPHFTHHRTAVRSFKTLFRIMYIPYSIRICNTF